MTAPPVFDLASFTKTWHNEPYPAISPTLPQLSAAGKNIVITGGGTGIGKATAIAFAQAGAKSVSIIGRRLDRLETAAIAIGEANSSTQVVLETGDVTSRPSLQTAMDAIAAAIDGKIDIFVSNAGMLPAESTVIDSPELELRRGLEINLFGSFNALQVFTPLAAPNAKLLNISSGICHWKPRSEIPGVWAYSAAKAATLRMMEFYAFENPGVHVVNVQPGIVGTEINPNIPVGPDVGVYTVLTSADQCC